MARYSLKIWQNVRAQYETGQFSVKDLSKLFGIAATTIQYQLDHQKWIKGKTSGAIALRIQESTIDRFTRLGMPPDKVAQRVLEGIECTTDTIKKIADRLKEIEVDDLPAQKILQKIGSIIKDLAEFKKVSLLYIQEYNRMIGGYAPTKSEITGANGSPLIPDKMSKDDIYNRIVDLFGNKEQLAEPAETTSYKEVEGVEVNNIAIMHKNNK